jgi:hypothetical protein
MTNNAMLRKIILVLPAIIIGFALAGCGSTPQGSNLSFPPEQPDGGNFNRPAEGEILDVSPPGFCWWRAGKNGQVVYTVRIYSEESGEVHRSPLLEDPVYVPDVVLETGKYTWTVDALDTNGKVIDTR